MKVVDASALAAVIFAESRAEEVGLRLEGDSVAAPTLLRYELANTCARKIRRRPDQRDSLLEALSLADCLDIEEVEVPAAEVALLALRTGLTAHDAAYLWLARFLRAELVTLDEELERSATRPEL